MRLYADLVAMSKKLDCESVTLNMLLALGKKERIIGIEVNLFAEQLMNCKVQQKTK